MGSDARESSVFFFSSISFSHYCSLSNLLFFFFTPPPPPLPNPMAPARTRRRSSGGAAAATAATPLSDGKAPLEAGTPGSVVAVRASAGGPASAAAVPFPASSTSVTPAPFAPLGGRGDQETVIDDLPEELLLKVREKGEEGEHAAQGIERRGENAARRWRRRRQLLFLLPFFALILAVYRLPSFRPRPCPLSTCREKINSTFDRHKERRK